MIIISYGLDYQLPSSHQFYGVFVNQCIMSKNYIFLENFRCEHYAENFRECPRCHPPGAKMQSLSAIRCCHKNAAWCCERCRNLILLIKDSSLFKFEDESDCDISADDFYIAYDYFIKIKGIYSRQQHATDFIPFLCLSEIF